MKDCIAKLEKGDKSVTMDLCQIYVDTVEDLHEDQEKFNEEIDQLKLQRSILQSGL